MYLQKKKPKKFNKSTRNYILKIIHKAELHGKILFYFNVY